MPSQVLVSLLSVFVGMFGGLIGSYVGMRVGLARIETWRDGAKADIDAGKKTLAHHGEDLLVHDIEIGMLMSDSGKDRVTRQWLPR